MHLSKQAAVAATLAIALSTPLFADNGSADFTMDGNPVTASSVDVDTGVRTALRYTGGSSSCTDVEWFFRKEGETDWDNFDSTQIATLDKIWRAGTHELKMTATGFNGKWFFGLFGCDHTGQYDERTVAINVATSGFAQTKHPIMLIPGVMAYDDILGQEYFYRVADKIRESSDQFVIDVALSAWQNTEDRGAFLANKIAEFLSEEDPHFGTDQATMKVNLIAHSHGSTTSRVAINILAKQFGDNGAVASLTTVAGPHYGTPTADGVHWALENWGLPGKLLGDYVVDGLIGQLGGAAVAFLSGHANEYPEQDIIQVLRDFTQKGMARFNTCYPSYGLPPGGKYFIEPPLEGVDEVISLPIVDGQVMVSDCQNFINVSEDENKYDYVRDTQFSAQAPITLAATPDEAYGEGAQVLNGPVYGNGLGEQAQPTDGDAVRYFSFTGVGEWNTAFPEKPLELADPALLVINSMFTIVGERTDESYFEEWWQEVVDDFVQGTPVSRARGYTKDSDTFIPIVSTRFGEFIGVFGPWNHMDEINGLLGWVDAAADDPLVIYENHVNTLQQSGL